MKKILILILISFLLNSCGSGSGTQANVRIGQGLDSSQIAGGAVVFALSDIGEKRTYVFQTGTELESAVLNLPFDSTWGFRIISWEGTNGNFTGTIRCGHAPSIFLGSGSAINLDINLTNSNCFQNNITVSGGDPTQTVNNFDRFVPIKLLGCGAFDDGLTQVSTIATAQSLCGMNPNFFGISSHFKISFLGSNPEGIGHNRLSSSCLSKENNLDLNLPIGFDSGPAFDFIIEAYESHGGDSTQPCSEDKRDLYVFNGLGSNDLKQSNIYPVQTLTPFYNVGEGALFFVFADNIAGVGSSPLNNLIGSFTCTNGSTDDCLPNQDLLDATVGADFVVASSTADLPIYLNNGSPCNTLTSTMGISQLPGVWGGGPPTYDSHSATSNCTFVLDTNNTSQSQGGAWISFDATVDGNYDVYKVWFYNKDEFEVREKLYRALGSSHFYELMTKHDGSSNSPTEDGLTKIDEGINRDMRWLLGAQGIGGLLNAAFPAATSCSTLPYDSSTFLHDFGEGPEEVIVTVADGSGKSVPPFICDADDIEGPSCSNVNFTTKISLSYDGGLKEVSYIHCSRKIGMTLESDVEGSEYRKKLVLWNFEDLATYRFETYQEELGSDNKHQGSYKRAVKNTNDFNFGFWETSFGKTNGNLNYANQTAVQGIANPGSLYEYRYRNRNYSGSLAGYSWGDITTTDGFYSNTVGTNGIVGDCVDLESMNSGGGCPTLQNVLGVPSDDDHTPGAGTNADPYFGTENSIRLDTIVNGFGNNWPNIADF